MVLTTKSLANCAIVSKASPCSGSSEQRHHNSCGCGCHATAPTWAPHGYGSPQWGAPPIFINNSPFMGEYKNSMVPVVNVPPVIVAPTQQTSYGPSTVPSVGGGRDMVLETPGRDTTTIIEQPIERQTETQIITREPRIIRESQVMERETDPVYVATTDPINRKPFFRKHYVPTFY